MYLSRRSDEHRLADGMGSSPLAVAAFICVKIAIPAQNDYFFSVMQKKRPFWLRIASLYARNAVPLQHKT